MGVTEEMKSPCFRKGIGWLAWVFDWKLGAKLEAKLLSKYIRATCAAVPFSALSIVASSMECVVYSHISIARC